MPVVLEIPGNEIDMASSQYCSNRQATELTPAVEDEAALTVLL